MVGHVASCRAGDVARLLQADVGIAADGKHVLLAMQPILQPPVFGGSLTSFERHLHLEEKAGYFAVGVLAGLGQRTDECIAEFSPENGGIIWRHRLGVPFS
ncbi:hypothetical protein D3C80_1966490 [compost metagenome]